MTDMDLYVYVHCLDVSNGIWDSVGELSKMIHIDEVAYEHERLWYLYNSNNMRALHMFNGVSHTCTAFQFVINKENTGINIVSTATDDITKHVHINLMDHNKGAHNLMMSFQQSSITDSIALL